ncbi:MAG: Rrf2 family transcriptional regulator [Eubacteriales bacterium]|nr:Rrf2 family transcriptional regulator [Eubacteriales bacterium]
MFITRECDYAVRVIRALGQNARLSVGEICEKEEITAPFAYKILKKLQKAGIVKGYRGVHGGYVLSQQPDELTLFDIYSAIDNDMNIIDCMDPHFGCPRDNHSRGITCLVHRELVDIQQEFWKLLKRKTLQEILAEGEQSCNCM